MRITDGTETMEVSVREYGDLSDREITDQTLPSLVDWAETPGIVDLNYGNGHVYAQHNNTGGAWINNLQAGQTFTMNGSTYRVNGQSVQGAQYAPGSGDWMQTCNGNGNHLVGITKIS